MSLIFSLVSAAGVQGAAVRRSAAAFMCAAVSSGGTVIIVHDIGKCKSLVGSIDGYLLSYALRFSSYDSF